MQANFKDMSEPIEEVLGEVGRIKTIVSEAVEDGVKSAMKAIKQGRIAAEDAIGDARHSVKQNPIQSIGIVFAVGVLTGSILGWLGTRRS